MKRITALVALTLYILATSASGAADNDTHRLRVESGTGACAGADDDLTAAATAFVPLSSPTDHHDESFGDTPRPVLSRLRKSPSMRTFPSPVEHHRSASARAQRSMVRHTDETPTDDIAALVDTADDVGPKLAGLRLCVAAIPTIQEFLSCIEKTITRPTYSVKLACCVRQLNNLAVQFQKIQDSLARTHSAERIETLLDKALECFIKAKSRAQEFCTELHSLAMAHSPESAERTRLDVARDALVETKLADDPTFRIGMYMIIPATKK